MLRDNPNGLPLPVRFSQLFVGWDKAHGVFRPNKAKAKAGKVQGGQSTHPGPPEVYLWEKHLAGEQGLGVFMLRDDETVRFAAIDVDVYPLPSEPILLRINQNKLPLVFCRSKSGGAHLYLFCKEPVLASLVRRKMTAWSVSLNLARSEIYPHKDALDGDSDFGKYLNMPYFGGEGSSRVALSPKGLPLTMTEFLEYAAERAVTAEELEGYAECTVGELEDGPPCLQNLFASGKVSHFRDNSLLNLATYLRQRFPDDWKTQLEDYHRKYIHPPLTAEEVVKIQRSASRKNYNYMCHQEPLAELCNSAVCIGRKYGVRSTDDDDDKAPPGFTLNLGQLTKFNSDPPTWELNVNGETLRLSTEQLMTYRMFRKQVLERLNVLAAPLKDKTWGKILEDKLSHLDIVEAPDDAGEGGQVRHYLREFCRSTKGRGKNDLKDGRVWWDTDVKDGLVYFRAPHFQEYLSKHRVNINSRELTAYFRRWNFTHGQFNMRGECVQWWAAPPFTIQTDPDDAPNENTGAKF